MSIQRITSPLPLPTSTDDYVAQNNLLAAAFLEMQLPVQVSGSNILAGSIFYLGGTVYKATADTAITGVSSEYIKFTPSGDSSTAAPSFVSSLAGVTWNDVYKGYYDISGNMYIWDFTRLNLEKTTTYENTLFERLAKQVIDYIDVNIGTEYIYNIQTLGNAFDTSELYANICKLTTTRIAVIYNLRIRTFDWDGTDWTQTGNALAITGYTSGGKLARLDDDTVAVYHNRTSGAGGRLKTFSFDGTDWTQDGNEFSLPSGSVNNNWIAPMTSSRIALFDNDNNLLIAMDWDGTDWTTAGNSFSLTLSDFGEACGIDSTRVAVMNTNSNDLELYNFDGTDWTLLDSYSFTAITYPCITMTKEIIFLVNGTSIDKFQLIEWNGASFSVLDYPIAWPLAVGQHAVAALTEGQSAFYTSDTEDIITLETIRTLVTK